MLNFSHLLVVSAFLFLLVPLVALGERGVLITLRERVEYPYSVATWYTDNVYCTKHGDWIIAWVRTRR